MAATEDKENVAPTSSDPLQHKGSSPARPPGGRKGRSKSIGPGDIEKSQSAKQDLKNRRKSAFVPASRSIISTEDEKAARQAARRKTLANRRVSFAPEATLHTWDVIEFMRDPTTSTDSSDQTRRTSNITRSSNGAVRSPMQSWDAMEPSSTPPECDDGSERMLRSPVPAQQKKQRRRSSGIPPMNFNNPDDMESSSVMSGSSDVSGSEDDEEGDEEDATGTAMSLDASDQSLQSIESGSSTSSSLTQRLRQAAETAGTRGIEYDEYGEGAEGTMSMEIAAEEITNAFKPWAQDGPAETAGSASLDQENVNPFSSAFKGQIASGYVSRPSTIAEEDTEDMSMDVTRAVGGITKARTRQQASSPMSDTTMEMTRVIGGIVKPQARLPGSSPADDATMDFTQAVGKIHSVGQKRRRSTTDTGSPGAAAPAPTKRTRRSSVARSSMGDDTMDLTMPVGGIQEAAPTRAERRRSVRRRSSGIVSEKDDATMDFTQAVGSIKPAAAAPTEHTASSFDENEELTMELTTVLGGIRAGIEGAPPQSPHPTTPQKAVSPVRDAANTTPKDQERFRDAPDSGPKKLLTPIFQKQSSRSAEKSRSSDRRRQTISPAKVSWTGLVFDEQREPEEAVEARYATVAETGPWSAKNVSYPKLPAEPQANISPVKETPPRTPPSHSHIVQQQLDAQLQPSPIVDKILRSTPARPPPAPRSAQKETSPKPEARNALLDSIRLLSTPRKETLKALTPNKSAVKAGSPVKATTPRLRGTPRAPAHVVTSPARQLSDDLLRLSPGKQQQPAPKIHLQSFLEDAGIRFMDLTATKRRLTTAPTPSKTRSARSSQGGTEADPEITLATAIMTAACTQPEHDMYQHACHELKHYISEGKKFIKQLEADAYEDTPPLLQAYVQAAPGRKAELDAQMRDMKTNARLRSREMWYAWRSQLMEDLMKGLSGIGEGLLRDDEAISRVEEVVRGILPEMLERESALRQEAERLERAVAATATTEEQKAKLKEARERLVEVDNEVEEKRRMLEALQKQSQRQDEALIDLEDNKAKFTAAIREAERVRESCRGVSLDEISRLKGTSRCSTPVSLCHYTDMPARINRQPRRDL